MRLLLLNAVASSPLRRARAELVILFLRASVSIADHIDAACLFRRMSVILYSFAFGYYLWLYILFNTTINYMLFFLCLQHKNPGICRDI